MNDKIETDIETFDRLAKFPPANYDRCREDEAKRLKIRVGTLDAEIQKRRPKSGDNLQGETLKLPDVELWPEAVSGADVLNEISATFRRYIVLPDGADDALALWVAHAHCFSCFICSPRLNISSPEKGCGKTTLRDVLIQILPRPLATENLSVAVLFRVSQSHKPTLLADECDSWIHDNEELRGMFNAGHRRGGKALRCEGDSNEVRAFDVFTPVVLCGIGTLPGTLHDRSIVVRLERAKSGEVCERFDPRNVCREIELCRKIARFCADNQSRLESCDPVLPPGAFNRLADNWRPLFTIAEIAGGDWPQRAAAAFAKLTSREDADAQGIRTMLLADIQQIFSDAVAERMLSKALVDKLCAMPARPWPEVRKGHPITQTWLARKLHAFGISPKCLRDGFLLRPLEKRIHTFGKFARCLAMKPEFKVSLLLTAACCTPFVEKFGVNQFENLLEGIHARIRQHQVFHVEDDVAEGSAFGDELVVFFEVFKCPTFGQQS